VFLLNVDAREKAPLAGSNVPARNSRLKPPMKALPAVKARDYP
jgi:hypothetical protein